MTRERAAAISRRISEMVAGDFGGWQSDAFIDEIRQLASELRRVAPDNRLALRIGSLVSDVEEACSVRRWQRIGLDRLRAQVREAAAVIADELEI